MIEIFKDIASTKSPIVILSSPRVGSTLLVDSIERLSGFTLRKYAEPYINNQMNELMQAHDKKYRYILKVHAYDLIKDYPASIKKMINNNDCYLIRIRRKNLIAQLTSEYISQKRKKWSYQKQDIISNNDIEIDNELIQKSLRIILTSNHIIDTYPVNFNLDLFYEDLDIDLPVSIPTPQPKNYDLIYQEFKKLLTD